MANDLSSLNDGTLTITADVSDLAGNAAPKPQIPTSKDTASSNSSLLPSTTAVMVASTQQKMAPSPSQAPRLAQKTVKPLPSTSPPLLDQGTATINTTATVNSNSQFRHWPRSLLPQYGTLTITADVMILAGLVISNTSHRLTSSKDTAAPTISVAINDGGDGRLNATEDDSVSIAGTTSGAEDGQTVAINISSSAGGTPINTTATVNSNSYSVSSISISPPWNDGTLTITADVDDLAGNSATQATDSSSKDTASPTISVAINDGGDGQLNAAEDSSVTIAGGAEDGQTVAINISSSAGGTPTINTTASVNSNYFRLWTRSLFSWRRHWSPSPLMSMILAGNSATQATDTSSKDTAAPTISVAINDGGDGSQRSRRFLRRHLWLHLRRRRRSNRFHQHLLLCWRHTHQHHRQRQ